MKHWLYDRRNLFVLLALLALLQGFIFFVYELESDAFWYLMILEFVVCNFYLALDYYRHSLSHRFLTAQLKAPDLSWMAVDGTQKDADYQRLIRSRERLRQKQEDESRKREADLKDAYDLWVHQNKLPISALRLLLQEETPDIRAMKSQVLRLEQYTQMVLALSRMNGPETDYVFAMTFLDPVVRKSIRTFSTEFISRKIRLTYDGCDTEVLTDARWLEFVIEQILSNALKHAKTAITLTVRNDVLSIRDDGPGIPASDLDRIFRRGTTGHNGRQETKATGLGLYLSHRILDELGHGIRIETSSGKGTEVLIDLSEDRVTEM